MDRSVAESWGSIIQWLEEHLPHALEHLQPPASWSEISTLRAAMDRRLPSDLIAWLSLNNGFGWKADFGRLLPFLYIPMGIDRMLRDREMLRTVTATVFPERSLAGEQAPAGSGSFEWLDGFLPIGDAGTDIHLFVDLREGEQFGCVSTFDNESEASSVPDWFSIGEMLADVADALTLNQPAPQDHGRRYHASMRFPDRPPHGWRPYIDENRLRWELVALD